MQFREKSRWNIKRDCGSVSLETALLIPVFLAVGLFFYYLAYVFVAYNCVSDAMYRTGTFFAKYAQLYHENAVERAEEKLSDLIYGSVLEGQAGTEITENLPLPEFRTMLLYGDDMMYRNAAERLFRYYFEKNRLVKILPGTLTWDFRESTFYNGNEEFCLHGEFSFRVSVPFCRSLLSGFSFEKTLRCRAFLEGDTPYSETDQTESVWDLSNFRRGKVLQSLYGRNLPNFFPDIDFFREGTVGTIRSIDHTKKYYESSECFAFVLEKLLKQLRDFEGASYGNININTSDIRRRELILIFPENTFSAEQQAVLEKFETKCTKNGISLVIERYQRSG